MEAGSWLLRGLRTDPTRLRPRCERDTRFFMYSPAHYLEANESRSLALIERYPFATVLAESRSEGVTHVPLVIDRADDGVCLLGHMARANPHWKELRSQGRARAVFVGPSAYVSPSWYEPRESNVPTWNYAVVHASGDFEIVDEPRESFRLMDQMTSRFEAKIGTDWRLPRSALAIENLMRAIVVFLIRRPRFEAKFKLSQKQGEAERRNVARHLSHLKGAGATEVASLMRESP